MAEITPLLVKKLRDKTGLGVSACKRALEASSGDLDKAVEELRKAGLAAATKKADRAAHEGLVGFAETDVGYGFVEVNCETDFVAKNERFVSFLKKVAEAVANLKENDASSLLGKKPPGDTSMTVDEMRMELIQQLGENIQIRRIEFWEKKSNTSIGVYVHMDGMVMSAVELSAPQKQKAARDVGMHIVAESPEYVQEGDVPEELIRKEREIAEIQASGKPAAVVEKIVSGKLAGYFDQYCLLNQKYIRDSSLTIRDLLQKSSADMTVVRFLRWSRGE